MVAKEKNHLITRVNDFTKKIHECINTKNATVIKHFWQDHADDMQALLVALNRDGMKKELAAFDHTVNHDLYKTVLINKSIRLAKDMGKAFAEKSIDAGKIKKFEKRGVNIEFEMKRMGFTREANMHSSLLRLHIKEEKKDIASRVKCKHSGGLFERPQDKPVDPREPSLDGDFEKHKP